MHPIVTLELIDQHHADLLRAAERHRRSGAVRQHRTFTGLLRRTGRHRAGPVPS